MNENEIRKQLKYKITWERNYQKLQNELDKLFEKPKPDIVGFFSLNPNYEYDFTTHCYDLNHINYICDVDRFEWIFCPICKIKTDIGINSLFTIPSKYFEKVMGIDWDEYCCTNQLFLDKCENLSDSLFQTRDEFLNYFGRLLSGDEK